MADQRERTCLDERGAVFRVRQRRQAGAEADNPGDKEHAANSHERGANHSARMREGEWSRPAYHRARAEKDQAHEDELRHHEPLAA